MTQQERQTRWRLILGAESQPDFAQMGAAPLSQEELLIDGALAAIYGRPEESFQAAGQGGGHGPLTLPNGWGICAASLIRRLWPLYKTTPSRARD